MSATQITPINSRSILRLFALIVAGLVGSYILSAMNLSWNVLYPIIIMIAEMTVIIWLAELLTNARRSKAKLEMQVEDQARKLDSLHTELKSTNTMLQKTPIDISGNNIELQEALESSKASNAMMNRLMRTVAHEFRNPLCQLTGSVDIFYRYWESLTFEQRFTQTESIRSATNQMSNLINSMISFNQMGTDRSLGCPHRLNINIMCLTIAAEVEAASGTGLECVVKIAEDCGSALLDEMQFRRILENLLTNAFRYTPANGAVSLHVSREKNVLCLVINDTGIGIPEEDQSLIFDPFYRSKNTGSRRGLGLGLSIVREAVCKMAATITVTSKIGEGTTMRVEIPVDVA